MGTYYRWDSDKNERLKQARGICFEQIVMHIDNGDLIDLTN